MRAVRTIGLALGLALAASTPALAIIIEITPEFSVLERNGVPGVGRARFQMGDSFFDVFTELQVGGTRIDWMGPPDPVRLTSGPQTATADSFFDVFFDVSQGVGLPAAQLGLEVLFQGTMVLGDGRLVFDASRANMLQLDPPFVEGQFEVIVQQVPEPSALLLLASGLAAAGWLRRRRPPQGRR